ncbi:MAG TPA: sigma-70 family RNA polymerase sigma factor [Polyangiaceae bacterium]|jgi:RNA polymerase sigma-70 factor (ECF subfamily)
MDEAAREALEREVRGLCAQAKHDQAATVALRGYGPEVLGFLMAASGDEAAASELFSDASEALWRSLPTFAWKCSLRTWTYAIARNLLRHRARDAMRAKKREGGGDSVVDQVAQAVRTETLAFLRTERKTRLQELRDALPEEERMLLVLRVDRQLAWKDLARVLGEGQGGVQMSDEEAAKEAARLRKQFQLVKDRLRELAKKEGLLE